MPQTFAVESPDANNFVIRQSDGHRFFFHVVPTEGAKRVLSPASWGRMHEPSDHWPTTSHEAALFAQREARRLGLIN